MARSPALFNGPIQFTDLDTGKLISLPLSKVFFEGGSVQTDATLTAAEKNAAEDWLSYLVGAGLLMPDPNPPVKVAMVIRALHPGAFGNSITVNFASNVASPAKLDVTVSERDVYTDLEPSTVRAILGTDTKAGTRPGLVIVLDNATSPALPATVSQVALAGNPAKKDFMQSDPSKVAFTLQFRAPGTDGAATTITITAGSAAGKFNLEAKWTKVAPAIQPSEIQDNFKDELLVSANPAAPAVGLIPLSGGTDPLVIQQPATQASAVVLG